MTFPKLSFCKVEKQHMKGYFQNEDLGFVHVFAKQGITFTEI